MAYRSNYSFSRCFNADGSMTKWYQILNVLNENGPMRRKEILDIVWPNRSSKGHDWDRGFCSSFFAQLNESGYAYYDPDNLCWHLSKLPSPEKCKDNRRDYSPKDEYNSWGLRAPRKGEWNGGTFGCGMYDKNGNYIDLWC